MLNKKFAHDSVDKSSQSQQERSTAELWAAFQELDPDNFIWGVTPTENMPKVRKAKKCLTFYKVFYFSCQKRLAISYLVTKRHV